MLLTAIHRIWQEKFFLQNENVLLSLFYEEISLKNSSFDRYLKSDFFELYGTGYHFGFKISYGIY